METKTCNTCHETKAITEFYNNKNSKDGKVNNCKQCAADYDKKYHQSSSKNKRYLIDLPPCDKIKFENGVITAVCKNCGKRFVPKDISLYNRMQAWKNFGQGESNLYCSDECKQACPLFGFNSNSIDPNSSQYVEKPKQKKARACQTNHLKQLQIDETGHTYCEKCGKIGTKESPMHLHHTLPVAQYGDDAINSAGHIILCKDCHNEIHKQCKTK